jgi:hypothetical protein
MTETPAFSPNESCVEDTTACLVFLVYLFTGLNALNILWFKWFQLQLFFIAGQNLLFGQQKP